jgi:MSHA biogenesis protein MshO
MRPVFKPGFNTAAASRLAQRGVTLIEMIVAIVIGGILIAMVGMFIRNQVQSYSDVAARTELADAAQSAVQRITYDLQNALPNSVRTTGNFLEFVPITDAGRYRAQKGAAGDDELDFTSTTDGSFNVLGPPVMVNANDQLVIFNLGIPGADVYAGTNRRVISSAAGALSNITYAGAQFPLASPTNRFQVVGGPVTLECAANAAVPESGTITRRWCYAYADPQPTAFATAYTGCAAVKSAIVVSGVSACSMNYTPAALQRNGMVSVAITLTKNGENVSLLHQAAIINTP